MLLKIDQVDQHLVHMYRYQNALKQQLYEAMMMHDYVENYLLHPKTKDENNDTSIDFIYPFFLFGKK